MQESAKEFHFFFLMVNLDCGYVSPFILMMFLSFRFPMAGKLEWLGCSELLSCPHSRVLVFSLQCSLNMLEGDTGYSHISYHKRLRIWSATFQDCYVVFVNTKFLNDNQCSCSMRIQLVLGSAIPLIWAFLGSIYSFLYHNSSFSMHLPRVYLWNPH